jgi:hypothetical protein
VAEFLGETGPHESPVLPALHQNAEPEASRSSYTAKGDLLLHPTTFKSLPSAVSSL